MTKLCSVCGTENRDDVQFCRACGTAFPTLAPDLPPAADVEPLAAGITCDECGFQNKPGVRYCANCGVSLLGTVIVPRSRTAAPSAADPYAGLSPPPISYPSFAPVAPYPPMPAASTPPDFPPAYDDPLGNPDIADADAAIAVREQEAYDAPADPAAVPFATAPAPNRMPLIVGAAVLALAAAAGAWWFLGSAGRSVVPVAGPASAPEIAAPASAVVPAMIASAPVTATVDAAASTPLTGIVAPEIAIPSSGPFSTLPSPPPVTTAPTAPVTVEAAASVPTADAEAKRVAAEKRREKAAKDKAERDAKTKTLAEQQQQQQATAAARADQEAQARRRADEAQRARPVAPTPTTQQPATAQARGVREICAGRGSISEAVCQSRECGAAEHFNEAICRQIRDADERRRNYVN